MTSKRKLHGHNQDLIATFNSLTYDHKYFRNVIRTYEQSLDNDDKDVVFGNTITSGWISKNALTFAHVEKNLGIEKDKSKAENYNSEE